MMRDEMKVGDASVSNQVVWGILQSSLPELAPKVEKLLAVEPSEPTE